MREPVSVPASPPVAAAAPAVPTVPTAAQVVAALPVPSADLPPAAAPSPAPVGTAVASESLWPCPRCGASVPISMDSCPDCGAGFLSGLAKSTSTKLPLVGDVGRMSQGQRLLIGAGISVVLMVVFVLLAEIGGHLFG